jgi:hypothetical protein
MGNLSGLLLNRSGGCYQFSTYAIGNRYTNEDSQDHQTVHNKSVCVPNYIAALNEMQRCYGQQ